MKATFFMCLTIASIGLLLGAGCSEKAMSPKTGELKPKVADLPSIDHSKTKAAANVDTAIALRTTNAISTGILHIRGGRPACEYIIDYEPCQTTKSNVLVNRQQNTDIGIITLRQMR